MLLFLLGSLNVWGEEVVYKTALFGSSYNSKGVSAYTGVSFSSTNEDFTVNVTNANNNNSGWEYIKIGGKKGAYTGTITTSAAIDKAITKVALTIDAITASNVTSITLKTSTDGSSWEDAGTFDKSTGAKQVTITSPMENLYYQIEAVCTQGSSNGLLTISKVEFYAEKEETSDPTACAEPTFSPAEGAVVSGTKVTLTTTTEDADIYYTMGTNPADPTTGSTKYTAPISITEATTIKAIAVKDGLDNSAVATASYTVVEPLTTMQAIFDAATTAGSTATDVYITFNDWKISGVKNRNAFLTDGTNGAVIYSTSNSAFVVNDVLSGTVACKVQLYNGFAEITSLIPTTPGLTVTSGSALTPAVKTLDQLSAVNTGALVTLENLTYDGTQLSDGVNTIKTYTTFYSASLVDGEKYNITGVYQYYQTAGQILPRSAADVELITSIATPTISPDPSVTYTEAQNISITCSTDGATIYYTTDGTDPKTSGTRSAYSAPFQLSASATIKAIANNGEDWSDLATAAYTINIPLPSHDFQITHKFETSEGFEFPDGWGTSYAEHEIAYTDDKVVFAGASKQNAGATIDDCPVTKNQAISLVLTNTSKIITAVRFDYKQWGAKAQTLTMKYSTDGGANYSDFEPALTATNFAIQALSLPAGVNAIQVTGSNSSNQVGLTSIAFDLANKPVVTKTVTITPPSNGTLVVKNAGIAITSGDAIEVGTTLTIEATPNTGYSLSSISVKDEEEGDVEINEGAFVLPSKNVTVSATFVEDERPEATLTLLENGSGVAYPGSHKQNDHVTLPNSVTHNCYGRVFVGWSTIEIAQTDTKPAYLEPGAEFTLSAGVNNLYAVYAAVATPAGYQKLESDAFETTATYVIGALNGSDEECYFYYYESVDANIWGQMTNDPATNAPLLFTLSGTADELVAQDAAGNYLKPVSGKFQMSASSQNFVLADDGTITTASLNLRYNTSYGLRWYSNTTGNSAYFYKVVAPTYNKYSTTCDAAIDAPAFDLTEGIYTSAQTVTITAAAGATIYYTLDGNDPTTSSDVYSSPIELKEAGEYTLKAFAVKGEAESDITSATYTINLPLTTIPAIFKAATSTQTEVTITMGDWVVSGVGVGSTTNEKTVYVTDGTNGFIIFAASHGFEVGDILSGTITCDLKKYNGSAELMDVTIATTGLIVTKGGTVTTASIVPNALAGVNTGALIALSNWKYDGEYLTDGTTSIKPFNTLFTFDALTENKYYNVTGIYLQFSGTKEILPRSAADIVELTQEAPTMTWYTSDAKEATIAANATYTINLGDAFAPVFETNSSGTRTYSSNNDAVATINASTGALELQGGAGDVLITCTVAEDAVNNYAAGSQSFTLRVLQGATVDYVVILAQYNGSWYAMKNTGVTSSKAAAIEVAYSEGKVWNLSTSDQEAITWKRTVNEGNVTFQDPNNKYLQTSNSNLAMGAEACIWTWNETYYRTGSQTRTFLYRPSASGFKSNAVSNAGSNDYSALPVITTAVFADGEGYTEVRSGLEVNRYYTVCLPKNITHIKGATFWNLQYKNADNTEVYLVEETAPEAGKPYIIQATATKLEVVYGDDVAATPVENGALRGTFTGINKTDFAALEGTVYLLINNAIRPRTTGNFLNANRAYVRYDLLTEGAPAHIQGRRVKTMPMQGQVATGVEGIQTSEIRNQKVLINGQLFILRGEKMYNANGQLVK